MISFYGKSLLLRLAIVVCISLAMVKTAIAAELLYSGYPPQGEQYYTASISCWNLDGRQGDEIIITDDYGSFQVLSWNRDLKIFIEKWVSDPVFEFNRVKRIFHSSSIDLDKSDILFQDDQGNLKIFRWHHYLVQEEASFDLSGSTPNLSIKDFVCGHFVRHTKDWEFVALTDLSIPFVHHNPLNFLGFGKITHGFEFSELIYSWNSNETSSLIVLDNRKRKDQEILIVTLDKSRTSFSAIHTFYPFKQGNRFVIQDIRSIRKIGWSGTYDNTGKTIVTFLSKDISGDTFLNFASLDSEPTKTWTFQVPSNINKWTLGDLTGNGFRELIILDFHGMLHLFDISENLAEL